MAAKVIARHLVDEALPSVVLLQRDPNARVRQAAYRAVTRLTSAG
jgi:vesicle coat complex subunit